MTRCRVLVVDDEPALLELFGALLRMRGWEVEMARSVEHAMERVTHCDYDLIVCDVRFPAGDGRTFYDLAVAARPELASRFLICTGDSASPETAEFLARHHLPVLLKPFRIEQLLRAVSPFFALR